LFLGGPSAEAAGAILGNILRKPKGMKKSPIFYRWARQWLPLLAKSILRG